MRRLIEGDDGAFELLMVRHRERVVGYLSRLTGRADVALDLAQETFVRLYLKRSLYREAGQFVAWLHQLARNLARDHFRRRSPTSGAAPIRRCSSAPAGLTAVPMPAHPPRRPGTRSSRRSRRCRRSCGR